MIYMRVDAAGAVVEISNEFPEACRQPGAWARDINGNYGAGWLNRNDIRDLAHAQELAASAGANLGAGFLAIDRGAHVSPRYDVIEAPALGDEVSMAYNGDYYPVGKVVGISKGYKQIRVDGPRGKKVFYRKGGENGAGWLAERMWRLVGGVQDRLNPEF